MIRNLLDHPINLLIVVLLIVVLVGWKKLPDAARSLGRSMRIFKSEVDEMKKDGQSTPSAASSDTVKGEAVHPNTDSNPDGTWHPTANPTANQASGPSERETHNQPPA